MAISHTLSYGRIYIFFKYIRTYMLYIQNNTLTTGQLSERVPQFARAVLPGYILDTCISNNLEG